MISYVLLITETVQLFTQFTGVDIIAYSK